MSMEDSGDAARAFARPPKVVGALLLSIGLLSVLISFGLAEASPVVRILGSAMALIGFFALVFGLVVELANKPPGKVRVGQVPNCSLKRTNQSLRD
jgi:heme A synthase